MNITLFKAAEDMAAVLDQIDPETGEILEGLDKTRDIVAQKSVAVVAYLKDTDSKADYLEQAAKELMARVAQQRKRNAWLREYLAANMRASGILHVKDERGLFEAKLDLERDKSAEVFDEKQLPAEYMREVPATEAPNKALILSDLKHGVDIPGARLVKRDRLTIK